MGIPQQINGWILQRTSELDAGYHALNSSGFSSRFNRAPVYRRLPEIPPSEYKKFYRVVVDSVLHNSTKAIVKATFEETGTANANPLSKKICTVARGQC